VDKPAGEQGNHLYPAGYGRPQGITLDYQRNRDLFRAARARASPRWLLDFLHQHAESPKVLTWQEHEEA